jgi:PEGA domain
MNSLKVHRPAFLGPCRLWPRLAVSLLLVPSLWATSAGAQTAVERETARRLMDRGDEQSSNGDYTAALASYRAAHAIMRVPSTGIEVARALDKLGELVEARDAAIEVLRMPTEANEPKPFQSARAAAEELTTALRDRIPVLTVNVTPSQATLSLDDRQIPSAAFGQPYFLNPGVHRLSLSAPSYRTIELTVTLAAGERRSLHLALQPSSVASSPPQTPGARATRLEQPAPTIKQAGPTNEKPHVAWPVWLGLGITTTGALVGTISGVLSLDRAQDAKAYCQGNTCTPEASNDKAAALSAARVSNVSWAVAGVGAALTVTAWWLTKADKKAHPTARLSVAVAPNGGEVRLSGALF